MQKKTMSDKKTGEHLYMIRKTLLILLLGYLSNPQALWAQEDKSHFSQAFQVKKEYRIFLPGDYHSSKKSYPVIYYFHGNKGDHRFALDGVHQLVKDHQAILVAWNGRSSEADLRPYNIGYHANINYPNNFKDYFLDLVSHIDSSYRTLRDRSSRAIIGHSMGGFMSFYLAGKYPHLVGTAVSSKGSPEFFVGTPENHTLYSVRHTFMNLHGIRLRFYNGTDCELKYLNQEVHLAATREPGLDYEYKVFEGPHKLLPDQFADAFAFVMESFKNPLPKPARWRHADLYANFEVWNYRVESNLAEPGYIVLDGVTEGGLTVQTRRWLPDGGNIPGVNLKITTAALYIPGREYVVVDYDVEKNTRIVSRVISDSSGRISFATDHREHKIAISLSEKTAGIAFTGHSFEKNGLFLQTEKEGSLQIGLYNLGDRDKTKLTARLSTAHPDVTILKNTVEEEVLPAASGKFLENGFRIKVRNAPPTDGAPHYVRFRLTVSDAAGQSWEEDFDAPVFYNVPEFGDIGVDDGDSETFGSGNGNNIAEPGERIAVYQVSNRTRLYYDDPCVCNEKLVDELQPDKWGDGYALSSVVQIAEDCPPGHRIRFLASFENKVWKTIDRKVSWGYFYLTVGEK
jgi:pimeloyl-ACP methyl ester carboxylesterase